MGEEEDKERKRKEKHGGVLVTVIEDNMKDKLKEEKRTIGKFEDNVEQKRRKVEMSNEIVVEKHKKGRREPACRDKFKNCQVVLQSRLCRYSFYQTNCCQSCSYSNK